jgi:hypothetical protein
MPYGYHPLIVKLPESDLESPINENIQRLQKLGYPTREYNKMESSLTSVFIPSVICPRKLLKTSMMPFCNKVPIPLSHTMLNHSV